MKLRNFICVCFYLFSLSLLAQRQINVSGIVSEQTSKAPIIGVNVVLKGTTTGAMTDIDGRYTLSNIPSNGVLVFSYIGMKTQEVAIGGRSQISITMEEDTQELKEVVVIGYGAAQKRDLTGSIVSIKAEEIADKPSSNPLASVQGKIAGVQVVNTGRAGQDPEIRVRGTNSINGYKPLYVVDGLFTDNINHLNPADIEQMEILKDPSSLAIFGVRGANGVIIISTKKAKKGQTTVNINSSLGLKTINDRISVTNGDQFRELYAEQLQNQGAPPFDFSRWTANTDWQDEIFRDAWISNHNISITGSGEKNKFYIGAGYLKEEGSIKNEEMSRITLNLSSDYNVTDFLRFGFQTNGARTLPVDAKGGSVSLRAAPVAPIMNQPTGLYYVMPDFQSAQVWNPMIEVETRANHNKATNYRIMGNVYGEVDFLKNFNFRATLSMDYVVNESRQFSPIIWVYNPDYINPATQGNDQKLNEAESISQKKSTSVSTQTDYILTFKKAFDKHNLTAMAGMTTNYIEYSSLEAGRSQKYEDIIFSIPNDNSDKWWISSIDDTKTTNGSSQYKRATMSYLVRALYGYDGRYLFNASFRRDGASVFRNSGNAWDNFYSVGAAWVATEEAFLENQKIIDYLKIKGSYGVLGSQNTGGYNYPTYPLLASSGSAVFGNRIVTGYAPKYLVQNLGWEKTYAWEVGAEFRFLNNRLSIEPTYYHKNTKDLIVLLSGISGAKNALENLGEIQNKGWEFSVGWNDKVKNTDFTYSISANLTTINNEVISLGRGKNDAIYAGTGNVSRSLEGYPIGHFYGYKVIGVYQNNRDINKSPLNTLTTVKPGDLKFADINNDGRITTDDREMIGNPTPDVTYGFNINLGYRGVDIGVEFMGVYGNEVYRNFGEGSFAQLNYLSDRIGRWNGEGTSNWEPILDGTRAINRMNSSYYIEDGSFFRIRNVQLGYTFPEEVTNRFKVKKIRLYANVQNLKTWSKNSGYTPEIGGGATSFGIDNGGYPMPTIFTYGVNLTF
ncbi:SusC/RagA family TonB-linked outer membrane protein [Capnocytophaga catalasegens]|uniref:SusC/RagA family TonB-linked outer membrane protein n=1 Tax=Capnocytophaga catalasegens TaxID=1004260 RepID=A0ABQ4VS54_9FLAO|nr:TonB-dependent receptor [Capnocytophaga catalasegens]GIZ15907.1 SusC/RagA family TonB-linked outer membrane protein [Capnocytophaga catalasegens]GJM54137.1 SusC/RagA family TonB-linked outer membrane protein [Capnocytophaga catalasegens]